MNAPISVSQLNEQIKGLLETTFCSIYVEGEISNLTYHNSGHIYFSIKDQKSNISCVMFRGNAKNLKFRLEVGQKVNISGSLTVYVPRGNYQLLCTKIEPSGTGALALAYEQLKTKLQIKGYFDNAVKKPLPKFPQNLFIVTSNTGAAIEDMKKVLSHRYPMAKMILIPALVQGEGAKESIVRAIKKADQLALALSGSIMVVGRGGGSIEDLWAFNEEIVADAIYQAATPIISAVGHESDFVISDFVADIRASTPSNAIEIATPDINELRIYVDSLNDELNNRFKRYLSEKEQILRYLYNSFSQHSLEKKFSLVGQSIDQLRKQFNNIFSQQLRSKSAFLDNLKNGFNLNDPKKKDKKGFVQLTKNSKLVSIEKLNIGDEVDLESPKYKLACKILSKEEIS